MLLKQTSFFTNLIVVLKGLTNTSLWFKTNFDIYIYIYSSLIVYLHIFMFTLQSNIQGNICFI